MGEVGLGTVGVRWEKNQKSHISTTASPLEGKNVWPTPINFLRPTFSPIIPTLYLHSLGGRHTNITFLKNLKLAHFNENLKKTLKYVENLTYMKTVVVYDNPLPQIDILGDLR